MRTHLRLAAAVLCVAGAVAAPAQADDLTYRGSIAGPGSGAQALSGSAQLALADGALYVSDRYGNRIEALDPATGTRLREWATPAGATAWQMGVMGGAVYVVASADNGISPLGVWVYGTDGTFLRSWGAFGAQPGQFSHPTGLAAGNGHVWVGDANRIQRFAATGAHELTVAGDHDPHTTRLALDAAGNLYATDATRIDKYDPSGTRVAGWGAGVSFGFASGIAIAPDGDVYVTDDEQGKVVVLDPAGHVKGAFGSFGTGDGQFDNAEGIAIAQDGTTYVADGYRIQVWGAPGGDGPGGTTPDAPSGPGPAPTPPGPSPSAPSPSSPSSPPATPPAQPGPSVPTAPPAPRAPVALAVGTVRTSAQTGTATLPVTVPGPGRLTLSGTGAKRRTATVKRAGTVRLTVSATGRAAATLRRKRKVTLRVAVSFRPAAGTSAPATTKRLSVTLRRR